MSINIYVDKKNLDGVCKQIASSIGHCKTISYGREGQDCLRFHKPGVGYHNLNNRSL